MPDPLNPQRLTPAASLNRVKIVDLPHSAWEAEVQGKTAYELLSTEALTAEIVRQADGLALAVERSERAELPRAFDRCFEADDPAVRAAAEAVAGCSGRHLGYLIVTLKRGDPANRQARADWDDSYWDYWARIRQIRLGGGLASGHFGQWLRRYAAAIVAEAGIVDCDLDVASYPAILPLIGVARSVPPDRPAALVFDFGQSAVKRAYAQYEAGTLTALRLLPTLPLDWPAIYQHSTNPVDQGRRLAEYMSATMAETWHDLRARGLAPALGLVVSMASYVEDNQPMARQGGGYAQLSVLDGNAGRWLAGAASQQIQETIEVTLLHDGTAAARAYAGAQYTAVIMLGTALGIGFAPPATGLRPITPGIAIRPL